MAFPTSLSSFAPTHYYPEHLCAARSGIGSLQNCSSCLELPRCTWCFSTTPGKKDSCFNGDKGNCDGNFVLIGLPACGKQDAIEKATNLVLLALLVFPFVFVSTVCAYYYIKFKRKQQQVAEEVPLADDIDANVKDVEELVKALAEEDHRRREGIEDANTNKNSSSSLPLTVEEEFEKQLGELVAHELALMESEGGLDLGNQEAEARVATPTNNTNKRTRITTD